MKLQNSTIFILLITLVLGVNSSLPDPSAKFRRVNWNLKDSFRHIIDYVKGGHHKKHENSDAFIQKANEVAHANSLGHCGASTAPHAWKFFGLTAAEMKDTTEKTDTWANHCFQQNYASFEWLSDYEAKITITASGKKYSDCSDTYSITDIYNYDLKVIEEEGSHEIVYKFHEEHGVDFVKKYGIKVIKLCDSHVHLLPDIYLTLAMFALDSDVEDEKGETTPKAIRDAIFAYHYEWLHHWADYPLKKRTQKVKMTPEIISTIAKTGDVFCRFAGTGLSSLIIWGTGAQCTHMGMFAWRTIDGEKQLRVLQSNGKGISEMSIAKFWETNDGTAIALLPLAPEYRAKFNFDKAYEWFKTVEGSPYGYANFLFGFIDTPNSNFPQVIDGNSWFNFISILNSYPILGPKITEQFWNRALSKRLGYMDEHLTWPQIIEESVKRGVTLGELISMPEKEEWRYDGKAQYVCSSFASAMLYHGGVFGEGITIVPQEQTPRDVMEMSIWDKDYVLPDVCKQNDPDLPYCQLDGIYEINPKFYNQVKPYDHMNENCPTKAPIYKRPDGC